DDRPARDAAPVPAKAEAPFREAEPGHHDSHRCDERRERCGMSGQSVHGVGVGTWLAGWGGARPKNSITSSRNNERQTRAITRERDGVSHNRKITTGRRIAPIRTGRFAFRTQLPKPVEGTPGAPCAQPRREPT